MNNFSEFKIEPGTAAFVGEKIALKYLIGVPIEVHDYRIEPSKKVEGTECLTLQIVKSGDKRVCFNGSKGLINQIRQVPREQLPFNTTIQPYNESYKFT